MANDTFIEVLDRPDFEELLLDPNFQQYSIPKEWLAWEVSHSISISFVMESDGGIFLLKEGCKVANGGTNCTEACGNVTAMFNSYDTLWNCMGLATASLMARESSEWINTQSEKDANELFHFGSLESFNIYGDVFNSYFDCAMQSCIDSRFGDCPDEFMTIQDNYTSDFLRIENLGKIMELSYCSEADPGIDFDIAGPGIILAYFIQFGLVFFFALSYKLITAWVRNMTWIFSLPISGRKVAKKRASTWQRFVSTGRFSDAISSSIVDVQETQALLLVTIAGATIATFTGKPGTGLGNIQTLSSWLTNSVILKGMVTAGSYPLLLIQIILHRCGRRWWYTLLFITINSVLVAIIESYRRPEGEALLERLRETASLSKCGANLGPRTFCLPFVSFSADPGGSKLSKGTPEDPQLYLSFNSRNQQPVYILTGFLILDWLIFFIRAYNSRRTQYSRISAENDKIPSPRAFESLIAKKWIRVMLQALWISVEALAFTMCILGLVELASFLKIFKEKQSNGKSAITISEWSFGQLVAVAVWLPAVSKFLSLLIDRDGLQQRIDKRYIIKKDVAETENELSGYPISDATLLVPNKASTPSADTELDMVALGVR